MDQYRRPQDDTLEAFVSSAYSVLAKDLSFDTAMRLGVELAAVSNRFSHLSGIEKTQFVQKVILTVLEKLEKESSEMKDMIAAVREFANTCLPQILSVAVDIAKGRIQFESIVATVGAVAAVATKVSWLSCLSACFQGHPPKQSVTTPPLAIEDVSKKISEESKNAVFEPRTESNQNNKTVDMAEVSVPNEAPLSPTAAYLLSLPPLPESRSETPELEKE